MWVQKLAAPGVRSLLIVFDAGDVVTNRQASGFGLVAVEWEVPDFRRAGLRRPRQRPLFVGVISARVRLV